MSMTVSIGTRKKREARRQHLADQTAQRKTGDSDGGIHKPNNRRSVSRREEAETRTEIKRPAQRRWRRASHLPAMPDIPGYGLKWVRIDGRDRGDHRGVFRHIQEGWEPARKSDFPKYSLPTQTLGQHGEVIGNGDMILMKMEEHMIAERNASFAERRDKAIDAVEADLKEQSHPLMPIKQKRRSSVEFRRVRKRPRTRVADDDDGV